MKNPDQLLFILTLLILKGCSDGNTIIKPSTAKTNNLVVPDTIKRTIEFYKDTVPKNAFDIEVYFFDVSALGNITPSYNGRPTYTGSVYIADYKNKTLKGPYSTSSTFPNSKKNNPSETIYNTVLNGSYIFNNRSGHKSGTRRGLNIVVKTGLSGWQGRYNLGFDMKGDTVLMKDVNVHGGFSDKGNYNSRGSEGCITILPKDTDQFFKQFDMEQSTTGNLEGGLYVFRTDDKTIMDQILTQIKSELK